MSELLLRSFHLLSITARECMNRRMRILRFTGLLRQQYNSVDMENDLRIQTGWFLYFHLCCMGVIRFCDVTCSCRIFGDVSRNMSDSSPFWLGYKTATAIRTASEQITTCLILRDKLAWVARSNRWLFLALLLLAIFILRFCYWNILAYRLFKYKALWSP